MTQLKVCKRIRIETNRPSTFDHRVKVDWHLFEFYDTANNEIYRKAFETRPGKELLVLTDKTFTHQELQELKKQW